MIDNIVKTVSKLPAGLQFLPPVLVNADGELHQIGWFLGSFSGISCRSTCFCCFYSKPHQTQNHCWGNPYKQWGWIHTEESWWTEGFRPGAIEPSPTGSLHRNTKGIPVLQTLVWLQMYPGKHCLKTAPRGAVRKGYEPCSNGSLGTGSTRGQV